MASQVTPDRPRAIAERVRSALRAQGVKVKDLTDEQRERALTVDQNGEANPHSGLVGKSLAEFVLDGQNLRMQESKAREDALLRAAAESSERRSEAAKKSGVTPPKRESRFPEDVRKAAEAAKRTAPGGRVYGPGPTHHALVREVVAKQLGVGKDERPTKTQITELVGAKNASELHAAADGKNKDVLKTNEFKALAEKLPASWTQGRNLAAILAAWTDQL